MPDVAANPRLVRVAEADGGVGTARRPSAPAEALLALLASAVLVALVDVQVLLALPDGVPSDLGDPLLQAWQVAWDGHALARAPGDLWDSNTFHPLPDSLAFSDALLGYAPAGLVGTGPDAAVLRYVVLWLVAHVLSVWGAYLLARQLGCSPVAAAVCAVGWGVAPWRVAQQGHLHVLSLGGLPLTAALLLRAHAGLLRPGAPASVRPGRVRAAWGALAWSVACWQLSLGFAVGLPGAYALAAVAGVAAVRAALRAVGDDPSSRRRRWREARPVLAVDALGAAAFGAVGLLLAQPYLRVAEAFPQARRSVGDLEIWSPPLSGFVTPHARSLLLGDVTSVWRDTGRHVGEHDVGLGFVLVLLAVVGTAASRRWSAGRRLGLAALAVALVWLGAGTTVPLQPYVWVFEHLPGWQGIRTPGRLVVLAGLLVALLAAAGTDALLDRARAAPRRPAGVVVAAALLLPAPVLAEGLADVPAPAAPEAPTDLAALPAPIYVAQPGAVRDVRVMYWSTDGFPAVANGLSGFFPSTVTEARERVARLDAADGAAWFRDELGVRTVVVPDGVLDDPPAELQRRYRAAGLDVLRDGEALVVDLRPLPDDAPRSPSAAARAGV